MISEITDYVIVHKSKQLKNIAIWLASTMPSWHGNTFRVTGALWGNPPVTGGFLHKGPVMRSFGVFAVGHRVGLPVIWDAIWRSGDVTVIVCLWFETPEHLYDVTVMPRGVWSDGCRRPRFLTCMMIGGCPVKSVTWGHAHSGMSHTEYHDEKISWETLSHYRPLWADNPSVNWIYQADDQ